MLTHSGPTNAGSRAMSPLSCAARALLLLLLTLLLPLQNGARASDIKEACVDAHSQAQDERTSGHVTLARKLFLTCAQAACPALVQSDCARFADELAQLQPSLSFGARDAQGQDLPDTTVYLDNRLLAARIEGASQDVDPGKHIVRFVHGDSEQVLTVLVASGEKGRTVVASFDTGNIPAPPSEQVTAPVETAPPHPLRKTTFAAVGAALAVTVAGGVTAAIGLTRIPSRCSLARHECAAPPGDAVFDDAASAVRLANVGFIVAGVGALGLTSATLWRLLRGRRTQSETDIATWGLPRGAGLTLRTKL